MSLINLIAVLVSFFNIAAASESALYSPWLTANFLFNWTPPGVNVSIPTTAQCDRINITWFPLHNGSPDPVPPYHLRIYTSTLTYPIIVDAGTFSPFQWTVPFPPDTQYQICMFDSRGQTGGCQEKYTVTPPTNSTQRCAENYTVPSTLSIQGVTENGPLTQYSWPDQCTTISLMAQNGTPPFNMTIAPSYHPPLNLTFNDMGPMKWTVTLGWSTQFWISVVDSLGASWAYGPMHSGGNGPTDCLHLAGNSFVTQPPAPESRDVSPGAAVGIAFGSLVFGVVFTLAMQRLLAFARRPSKTENDSEARVMTNAARPTPGIDPYPIESIRSSQPQPDTRPVSEVENNPTGERADSQVYVVHHDAGGAPITIFTGGRDVQELPPHYSHAPSEPSSNDTPSGRPTHTPSVSLDSTANTSRATRRTKMSPPQRTVTN